MNAHHVCDGIKDCPNGLDEDIYTCDLYWSRRSPQGRALNYKKQQSANIHLFDHENKQVNTLNQIIK